MLRMAKRSMACAVICAACALLLAGCWTQPTVPDVGMVVKPNKVKLPPVPTVVQETEPKPIGYFQQRRMKRAMTTPTKQTE